MSAPTFDTRLLGQTEKTLNAILGRLLAGTDLSETEWVILNVTAAGGASTAELTDRVMSALKVPAATAAALVQGLVSRGVLADADSVVRLSPTGAGILTTIRGQVGQLTDRLWGDVPADDLDTAARVLTLVLDRANVELSELQPTAH